MNISKIRTMVVDDSVFYRGILSELLKSMNTVEFTGSAANGRLALAKIEQSPPDLVTLDVEMPEMNGLEVLKQIRQKYPDIHVVMISAATKESAMNTIKALEQGALEFIEKPDDGSPEANERNLLRQLRRVLRIVETKIILKRGKGATDENEAKSFHLAPPSAVEIKNQPIEIIVIGVSTGGPQALPEILENLPMTIDIPIIIVQHLPPTFVSVLVESLNRRSKLPVVEARDNQVMEGGKVYLAPGDQHLKVIRDATTGATVTALTKDPPENFCRPSVDYLFRSIAQIYGGKVLAVIMTGMGRDGTVGMKLLKEKGALTLAQDEGSSVIFGMAMEAIRAGVIDRVLSLKDIAPFIGKRFGSV